MEFARGIDPCVGVLVDGELLVHDLDILLLDGKGNLGADFAVLGVAADDFVLADVDDVFVMDALEELAGDLAVDVAVPRLADDDVLRTDDDVDLLVNREVIDDIPSRADETAFEFPGHRAVIDIGFADEVSDESVDWFVIDIFWGTGLLDDAVIHDDDGIGHREGFFLVVGDIDKGDAEFLMHLLKLELHVFPHLMVKRGKRFVEEKDLRFVDDGAGDRDTLLLTAGKGIDVAVFHILKVDNLKGAGDSLVDFLHRDALHLGFDGAILSLDLDWDLLHLEAKGDVIVDV